MLLFNLYRGMYSGSKSLHILDNSTDLEDNNNKKNHTRYHFFWAHMNPSFNEIC